MLKIETVLKDISQRTGEPLYRLSAQYVPFNPRPFQGGVLVKVRRKLVSFNVRMDDAMLGVDVEKLGPEARVFWTRFRANVPAMRLIDKQYGDGPGKEINKLSSTVSMWSFTTDMGGILSGAFVPFSAYDKFKIVADSSMVKFKEEVDYVAKSAGWWFEQSEKYHRGMIEDSLTKLGRDFSLVDAYLKALRDQLPSPDQVRELCSLDYGVTYIVGDPKSSEASDAVTLFERDVTGKLVTLLYRDLLDPLYKSLTSKSGITPSRVDRVRELVDRVRTLNVMDSAEVSALASRIEEALKERAAVTEEQFGKRLADLAAICRDDLLMLAVDVPKLGSVDLEDDVKPAALKAARKALALPDEPDIPRIRFEVPKLKAVEEVAS